MKLTVTTPAEILERSEVTEVIAEGVEGSFALLPRHIDIVTALVPGIIGFVREGESEETFVAADEGVLVKRDDDVTISVVAGTTGVELSALRRAVDEKYRSEDERERRFRTTVTKLETELARRFLEMQREA